MTRRWPRMKDRTMLLRTNSSICHVVVLKYFDASKIVRSRGMMQTATDLAAEAGAGMDTTGTAVRFLRIGMGQKSLWI
jgi:hypothetical protein